MAADRTIRENHRGIEDIPQLVGKLIGRAPICSNPVTNDDTIDFGFSDGTTVEIGAHRVDGYAREMTIDRTLNM